MCELLNTHMHVEPLTFLPSHKHLGTHTHGYIGMCTRTYTFCTHLMYSYMSKNKQIQLYMRHPQIYPHLLYVHTPESSCLMLAAFVPAQRQWEPACWQIIPLQPPLSNGKNAAACSSSPLGGNLPSHITDNKPHCCCFAEIAL